MNTPRNKSSADTTAEGRDLWTGFKAATDNPMPSGAFAIDGSDANLIAAYLDERLSPEERDAVEQRLARDPVFLDAWLAAGSNRGEADTLEIEAPAAVKSAAAAILSTNRPGQEAIGTPRRNHRSTTGLSGWFRQPAFAWAVAASVTLLIAAGAALLLYTGPQQAPKVALKESTPKSDTIEKLGDTFLSDPAKVFFDGVDLK